MYKVGIIGLGQIAYYIDKDPNRKIIWSHIKAYQATPRTEMIAVCSRQEEKVNRIKAECGIEKGYTDYKQMLEENDFDIISICTPIETHFDIVKKCIETGVKAVFCEKTLSYSLEQAEKMVELSRQSHTVLGVNYILRWDNLNREIKELLEQNAIGKIYTLVGYGATALHTSASHLIDLMVYFADSQPEWVVGEKQTDFVRMVNGVEDPGGTGTVKFKNGAMGFIKGVSTSPFKYMLELDILGENGRIRLYDNGLSYDFYQYTNESNAAGANYEGLKLIKTRRKDNENERMVEAVSDIIHCLEHGGQPLANAESSLASIRIIEGIKHSSGEIFRIQ